MSWWCLDQILVVEVVVQNEQVMVIHQGANKSNRFLRSNYRRIICILEVVVVLKVVDQVVLVQIVQFDQKAVVLDLVVVDKYFFQYFDRL